MRLYLVRTYLPDVHMSDVHAGISRVADAANQLQREGFAVRLLDTTYVPADGWLGCRYEADSLRDVQLAVERAVLPFDEIVEAICSGARVDLQSGGVPDHDQ